MQTSAAAFAAARPFVGPLKYTDWNLRKSGGDTDSIYITWLVVSTILKNISQMFTQGGRRSHSQHAVTQTTGIEETRLASEPSRKEKQNKEWSADWIKRKLPVRQDMGWLFRIYGKIKHVPNHQPVTNRFHHKHDEIISVRSQTWQTNPNSSVKFLICKWTRQERINRSDPDLQKWTWSKPNTHTKKRQYIQEWKYVQINDITQTLRYPIPQVFEFAHTRVVSACDSTYIQTCIGKTNVKQ